MIARLHAGDALADLDHDAGALMTQNRGEQPLGIAAGEGEFIGVADACGLDLDHHLAGLGTVEIDLHHFQLLAGLKGHGGTGFHGRTSYLLRACLDRPAGRVKRSVSRDTASLPERRQRNAFR